MQGADDRWADKRRRDRELVEGCLRGDEGEWVEVWQRYGPLVKSVARRVGCDGEEARDVLQRVALVALQRLGQLRDPSSRCTRRSCTDAIRSSRCYGRRWCGSTSDASG